MKKENKMDLTKEDALQSAKALIVLIMDSAERGTLPPETYLPLLGLLLVLIEQVEKG